MKHVLAFLFCLTASAAWPPEWSRPFPAHQIAGNVYYVGTEDLACYLVTDPAGHILINTGMADSVKLIRAGVEKLGFRFSEIKILLTMQAHFDHVAGFAEIVRATGAKVYATEADAGIIESGGKSDPWLGKEGWFEPVKVSRRLKDGETVELGAARLKVLLHPGHTPGSASYSTTVTDGGRERELLFVNLGTVVMPLIGNKKYPGIVQDFERTFASQKKLRPEIWLAGHASQYGMAAKRKAGGFIDPEGYIKAVAEHEQRYRAQLAKERK